MEKRLTITVDGPAGSGKSTVSRILAERISYMYLDTGLLYRAIAYKAMQRGISIADDEALRELCDGINIPLETDGDMKVLIDGEDVSNPDFIGIKTEEIGMLASSISAVPMVRDALLPLQRSAGKNGGIVTEGRDMGTVVFPSALVKFFLVASAEVRARRRQMELDDRGHEVSLEKILAEQDARDLRDRKREVAPLVAAPDAIQVDSTSMSREAMVEHMARVVALRVAAAG